MASRKRDEKAARAAHEAQVEHDLALAQIKQDLEENMEFADAYMLIGFLEEALSKTKDLVQ